MRSLITVLGLLLAACSLSAQQTGPGREAAPDPAKAGLALPDKERDLTSPEQAVTVVIGSVGLVAVVVTTPFVVTYGGETRIGPYKTPTWSLDVAGALIALAALNFTFNEVYHIDPDKSLISIFGIAIGRF